MLVTPIVIIVLWLTCVQYEGSLARFFSSVDLDTLYRLWPRPTLTAAGLVVAFAALQAVLMAVLPGKTHYGPVTPTGNRPLYKLNGVLAYVVTHLLLYVTAFQLHWFSPSVVYDNFGSILTTLTLFSLLFCVFLYLKGSYFPSASDAGRRGNLVWDYYWGVELHPRIFNFDLKQYANCRLGMMGWSVIIVAFLAKQHELYGHVSSSMLVAVVLQLVYITKFFFWERGYLASIDVMHDRFGFYICWGVTCWLPGVYTLGTLYLVNHPLELPLAYASFCLALGLLAIWANYAADAQRQRVRETNGNCTIAGRRPELILATYRTMDGRERTNLLLASGWWGLSRHFHYIPEFVVALAWSLPAMFDEPLPYFYVGFLAILLVHRSIRDERRCGQKYGAAWQEYCRRVPYRIVPFVF